MHLLRRRLFYKVLSLKDSSSVLLTAPGSLGEKAAVFVWGRKWCRIKVTFLCPSSLAPECTSLPAICGSDIKLGFQLFPANILTTYIPIPWSLFMVSGLHWGFDNDCVESGVPDCSLWHILFHSLCPCGACYRQKSLLKSLYILNQFTCTVWGLLWPVGLVQPSLQSKSKIFLSFPKEISYALIFHIEIYLCLDMWFFYFLKLSFRLAHKVMGLFVASSYECAVVFCSHYFSSPSSRFPFLLCVSFHHHLLNMTSPLLMNTFQLGPFLTYMNTYYEHKYSFRFSFPYM